LALEIACTLGEISLGREEMTEAEPNLDLETPEPVPADDIAAALIDRHALSLTLEVRRGKAAAVVCALVPSGRRTTELFVFVRGERALDRAVDFLDGVLPDLKKGRRAPLDWEKRAGALLRGEERDYGAEEDAARLLAEPPRPRGLAGLARRFD
jgi:hypothetical protein